MTNIETLLDGVVTGWQDTPSLLALLDGEPGNIEAYKDLAPTSVNLSRAVFALKAPKILVAWRSTVPGRANEGRWNHVLSVYIMAGAAGPMAVWREMTDGIVTATGQKFMYSDISDDGACYTPMDASIQRVTNTEAFDYFEARLIFTEIGDQ